MSNDSDEYKVGYGKPPKKTQFKAGKSGNPRGRKKGARGLKTDLHRELSEKVTLQINGERVTETKQAMMMKTLATRAATGDVKAAKVLLDMILTVFGPEDRGAGKKRLSKKDQALLDVLIEAQNIPCEDAGQTVDGQCKEEGDETPA